MTYQDSPRSKKVARILRYQWLSTYCRPESHCTPPILWKMSHSHLPWKPGSSTAPLCSHHIRQLAAHHNTQHTKKIISYKSFSTGLDSVSVSVSLFSWNFIFIYLLFPVGWGAFSCLCAKQKQGSWWGRGEKKKNSWTYLTRGERRNVRGIVFLHTWAHVWVCRQIKVFHKHIIGTILWELQAQLAGTNLQIWVLHLPHHIVLENHLLVAHLWDLKWAHSEDLEEEEAEAHQLKEKLTSSRWKIPSSSQENFQF